MNVKKHTNRLAYPVPGEVFTPDAQQHALTERYLTPHIEQLVERLTDIRGIIDLRLKPHYEKGTEKEQPYPYGLCFQLTEHVISHLNRYPKKISAIDEFKKAGGYVSRIWGDLRGEYFQNAIQMGSLYVDVSNDTVVVTKPKVEILALDKSGFNNFSSYKHYTKIGTRYLSTRYYPNFIFPKLAPLFPTLLHDRKRGWIIQPSSAWYFLSKNTLSNFSWAEDYLFNTDHSENDLIESKWTKIWAQFNQAEEHNFCIQTQHSKIKDQMNTEKQKLKELGLEGYAKRLEKAISKASSLNDWLNRIKHGDI